ncbi:2-oxoacid:ferredoxin oxidoreductase subunit beta [Alkaliphilus hydrothermalis]|uniref:2-oxoglutarate ferredoxin oxidoreductase subunit beta n=1 Tax=Alkaliphilus hydrothermalis TaxID=1482730 RepID=A0ABS2NRN3_9FIRM|nr:2-oxoacid:ferredoxin oxidoreductase subunit beta [Alkaliphilus hydrothermalis]MBM7615234.1 2-oxoglutarate ferredoxin oxidoreductase subunit beta [Alkaliphilus hydrothermalis]
MTNIKDYDNNITPNWCPGCGHFSIQRALQVVASRLEIPNEKMMVVSGIGCSGRISGYMNTYSFHGIHGRSLPIAQGIKASNKDLTVIAAGGDGDGFAIGLSHTLHAIRRNMNVTYIVLNNQIYGLTKGHTSPLSEVGFQTKSTPTGSLENPIRPGIVALSNGITFLGQGFSAYQEQLIDTIVKAVQHDGFSLVNVFSPCVTYNKINTYQWFREHLVKLDEDEGYNPQDYQMAMNKLIETDGLCTGIIYQNEGTPSLLEQLQPKDASALSKMDLQLSKDHFNSIINQYR